MPRRTRGAKKKRRGSRRTPRTTTPSSASQTLDAVPTVVPGLSRVPGLDPDDALSDLDATAETFVLGSESPVEALLARSCQVLDWPRLVDHLADRAALPGGRERCQRPVLHDQVERVNQALELVSEARAIRAESGSLPLAGVGDPTAELSRARRGQPLSAGELLGLRYALDALHRLRESVVKHSELAPQLSELAGAMVTHTRVVTTLDRAFEDGEELSAKAYPQLRELRSRKARLHAQIRLKLESMMQREKSALQDDFIALRSDRYVVPVKSHARSLNLGIVHDTSASGQTVFVEPHEIIPLNNQLKLAEAALRREEERILAQLSTMVGEIADDALFGLEIAVELDTLHARAVLADDMEASAPEVVDEEVVDLIQARHPLLILAAEVEPALAVSATETAETIQMGVADRTVVPQDICFGLEQRGLIISGPNTGGKTVALKTLGLLALMVRAGMHVPARHNSTLGLFPMVMAELGDSQTIEGGLSTFSGHIASMRRILDALERREGRLALVLADEVATGTDPAQGAALARAILLAMVERGALVLTTTHYAELKALSVHDDRFINAQVLIDPEDGRPTYQLRTGQSGRSHAFDIAERLGLPSSVLALARESIDRGERDLELLQKRLEEKIARARVEADRLRDERIEVEKKSRHLEGQIRMLERRALKLRDEVRAQFEGEVSGWREQLRTIIRELQQTGGANAMRRAQQAQQLLGQRMREHRAQETTLSEMADERMPERAEGDDWSTVRVGGAIFLRRMGKPAEVLSLPEKGRLQVKVAGLRMWVKVAECALQTPPSAPGRSRKAVAARGPSRKAAAPPRRAPRAEPPLARDQLGGLPRDSQLTLDLRGKRVEEGLAMLEDFMDRAALGNKRAVFVLHGLGTGALRNAVREYLRTSRQVACYQRGAQHQGGDGITVAALR